MSFNRIARAYRTLELLSFGPYLRRTREHFLPRLLQSRNALILGDGDGRFLHALLQANPHLQAFAIDGSWRMLDLLSTRCQLFHVRLRTKRADLRQPQALAPTLETSGPFDLVATHFFLDCLSPSEIDRLLAALLPHLAPGAQWVVSEFRIPPRGPLRPIAALLVRSLYLAFRLLTGLRVRHLPDYPAALRRAGLHQLSQHRLLGGILSAELWSLESEPLTHGACRKMKE